MYETCACVIHIIVSCMCINQCLRRVHVLSKYCTVSSQGCGKEGFPQKGSDVALAVALAPIGAPGQDSPL